MVRAKSTALKILSRIMRPTRGRMVVNGRLSALIEVTAGFHPDLTGMENIFLHGTILGMKKREIQSSSIKSSNSQESESSSTRP